MADDIGNKNWASPVAIHIGNGPREYIHGPDEALDYLYARWPLTDGPHMFNAKQKCRDAITEDESDADARKAFIAAAIEADVLC